MHPELLSGEEKEFLDENGYLPLEGVLSDGEVKCIRKRLDKLAKLEGENAGSELHQEEGTVRLANLIDKGAIFEKFIATPRVLAGITHVLGTDIRLSSLSSRSALPNGQGQQRLHCDWGEGVKHGEYMVCNSTWLIDDYTKENGGTRIVPGSHRSGQVPSDVTEDLMADHHDQINLTGRAGTVIIFNSHLWHGGAVNHSDEPRRGVLSYWVRRGYSFQNDHRKLLSDATKKRLSEESLVLAEAGEPNS